MKKYLMLGLFLSTCLVLVAQTQAVKELPEYQITEAEVEAHLRFLASDELKGRYTGSEGNNIAARYIAAHLNAYGFQPVEGADEGYFQYVYLESTKVPEKSNLTLDKKAFEYGEDYLLMLGGPADINDRAVFAGHGWVDAESGHDDYKDLDVEGKVVFVLPGTPDANTPQAVFRAMSEKHRMAEERGAAALIELYRLSFPWQFFKRYFGKGSIRLRSNGDEAGSTPGIPYGWIKDISDTETFQKLKKGKKVKVELNSSGYYTEELRSQNVIGVLEGNDPELKNEYIILSAHYDHVGVGAQGNSPYTEQDSIFNGARDDAMGVTAILSAAKALSKKRPRRSILVMGFTGEELGLLGSQYYAENPLIPLEQTIFNANNDTPGYNDTSIVSIFGYGRTGTDEYIEKGLAAFGLEVFPDPAPEQNLYDRSDNVSFAQQGVPALTFSPGFTSFDEEINKYYHQVTDNPETINFEYLKRYSQAYTYIVRMIANADERPWWKSGDKYEKMGKKLYEGGTD